MVYTHSRPHVAAQRCPHPAIPHPPDPELWPLQSFIHCLIVRPGTCSAAVSVTSQSQCSWCTTPSPPQCACTSPTPTASAAPPTPTPSITSASAHPLLPSWPPSLPPWLAPAPAPRLPPAPTCGSPARPPLCTLGRGRWCAWQPSQPWTVGGATCTLGCTARPSPLPTSLTLLLAPPALRWPASGSSLGTFVHRSLLQPPADSGPRAPSPCLLGTPGSISAVDRLRRAALSPARGGACSPAPGTTATCVQSPYDVWYAVASTATAPRAAQARASCRV